MKIYVPRARGFTLIELMVVIAIISILASFAVPSFKKHIAKANLVDVQLFASNLTNNVDEFLLTHSSFPSSQDFSLLIPNYDAITEIQAISDTKVDTLQGSFTVTLTNSIGIKEGQYLKYSRTSSGRWLCESTLDISIKPTNCTTTAQP